MKSTPGYRSSRVEDRRGSSGGGGLPGGAALKLGGASIPVILLVVLFTVLSGGGDDLGSVLDQVDGTTTRGQAVPEQSIDPAQDPEAEMVSFVSFVFDDVQATWDQVFADSGLDYAPSTLVLYRRGTQTAGCGFGQSAAGPFYCPADSKTYLDLSFFDQMRTQLGAGGDFAQAYVIAHEVGHHVQNQLGVSSEVRQRQQANPSQANDLSVSLELQADCFAGVWGWSALEEGLVESGDLEEAMEAAEAIGDDSLQGANANPETFTHGTSAQRQQWFMAGYDSGDPNDCNTFE